MNETRIGRFIGFYDISSINPNKIIKFKDPQYKIKRRMKKEEALKNCDGIELIKRKNPNSFEELVQLSRVIYNSFKNELKPKMSNFDILKKNMMIFSKDKCPYDDHITS